MIKNSWNKNNLLKHVERIELNESKANIKKIKKIREGYGAGYKVNLYGLRLQNVRTSNFEEDGHCNFVADIIPQKYHWCTNHPLWGVDSRPLEIDFDISKITVSGKVYGEWESNSGKYISEEEARKDITSEEFDLSYLYGTGSVHYDLVKEWTIPDQRDKYKDDVIDTSDEYNNALIIRADLILEDVEEMNDYIQRAVNPEKYYPWDGGEGFEDSKIKESKRLEDGFIPKPSALYDDIEDKVYNYLGWKNKNLKTRTLYVSLDHYNPHYPARFTGEVFESLEDAKDCYDFVVEVALKDDITNWVDEDVIKWCKILDDSIIDSYDFKTYKEVINKYLSQNTKSLDNIYNEIIADYNNEELASEVVEQLEYVYEYGKNNLEESKVKKSKVKESIKGNTKQFVQNVVDYLNEFMETDQDWLDMENDIIGLQKYERFNSLNGAIKKYVEGARFDVYDNQVREALNRLYINTPEEVRRWEKYPDDKVWERYVNVMCMYIPKAFKLRMGRELGSGQISEERVNEGRVKDNFTDKTEAFIDDMVHADLPNGDLQGAVELFAMQNGLDDDMLLDIIRDRQRELNESKIREDKSSWGVYNSKTGKLVSTWPTEKEARLDANERTDNSKDQYGNKNYTSYEWRELKESKMKEKYWKNPDHPQAKAEKDWWLKQVKVENDNRWEKDMWANPDAMKHLKNFGRVYVDTISDKPIDPKYVADLIEEWGDKE